MNFKQLSIIVVFACLVAPVFGGFLAPNSYTEEISYNVSEGMDITQRLNNTSLVVPRYSNNILNNQYLYVDSFDLPIVDLLEEVHRGNTVSTKATNYPYYDNFTELPGISGSGMTQLDLRTLYPADSGYAKVVLYSDRDSAFYYDEGSGTPYLSKQITYYPKTYTMEAPASRPGASDWSALYSLDIRTFTSDSNISIRDLTSITGSWSIAVYAYGAPTEFFDPADGFLAYKKNIWMNGQDNSTVAMLTSLPDLSFSINFATGAQSTGGITVARDGSNFTAKLVGGEPVTLIGLNASHILFVFDRINNTIQISMIQNMAHFTDNFEACMGQTETFETSIHSLTWLTFDNIWDADYNNVSVSYYVPYVYVLDQTTTGMHDVTISPQAISNNGLRETGGVVSMSSNVTYYGDSITITTADSNGSEASQLQFDVVGSKMVNTQDENDWYYIAGVTISLIPDPQGLWHLFINGTAKDTYFEPSTAQTALTVQLGGDWKAGVLLAYVNEYNYNHYDWVAGTFNLNLQGYCTIGIITSVIASIGCVIFAREEGPAGLIPMAIAIAFAAIYLFLA